MDDGLEKQPDMDSFVQSDGQWESCEIFLENWLEDSESYVDFIGTNPAPINCP